MDKLLTPEEVADLLSVSLKTVGNWLRSGQLQGIKLGRLWRISRPELERFVEVSTTAPGHMHREAGRP